MIARRMGISTRTFDLDGARLLRTAPQDSVENHQGRRRATRTPTLDGAAVVYDAGYSAADREVVAATTLDHLDWMARIVQTYSEVIVCTDEGAYVAVPQKYWAKDGLVRMRLLLLRTA